MNKSTHTLGRYVAHGCTVRTENKWENGRYSGGGTICITYDPDADSCPTDEQLANAERIALACNCHADLVEALKLCQVKVFMHEGMSTVYSLASAAISKAEAPNPEPSTHIIMSREELIRSVRELYGVLNAVRVAVRFHRTASVEELLSRMVEVLANVESKTSGGELP